MIPGKVEGGLPGARLRRSTAAAALHLGRLRGGSLLELRILVIVGHPLGSIRPRRLSLVRDRARDGVGVGFRVRVRVRVRV